MSEPTVPPVAPFDPIDPQVMECPYPHLRRLQDEAPVHSVENAPYLLVTRHAEVQDVLRRHQDFSSALTPLFEGVGEGSPFVPSPVFNFSDPPVHGRTKSIAVRAFGPSRVKAMEADIRRLVDDLIDRFIDRGEVDLLNEFALPLPMTLIAHELGIPSRDTLQFKHWSDQMLVITSPSATRDEVAAASASLKNANAYFADQFRAKRADPGDDLISKLVTAQTEQNAESATADKPRPLTDDEALSMIQLMLVGGNETTTNAILNAMLLLTSDAGLLTDLRSGKLPYDKLISESLRLESPVRGFWRIATRDTEIGGTPVPQGKLVFVSFAAANRDPRVFEDPDTIRADRPNDKSHLTFGHGIHMCVGFRLALTEVEIALRRLVERMENFQIKPQDGDGELLYIPTMLTRGLKSLHLTFDKIG